MLSNSAPSTFLVMLSGATMAAAHMELLYPIPFNSKYDKSVTNPDYSMTSPLLSDGSNYPCKGYQSMFNTTSPKAELVAGANFNFTLTGSARHSGGSCELSVSYDQAETFAVIHRISGGCPLEDTYAFTVPDDLPGSDKAIFAWTWFNEVGNREMYMNCAAVSIQGSATSYTAPQIFRANTFADGTCRTVEGVDVQFPPVGAVSTAYDGSNTASTPATVLDNCPVDQGALVTVTSSGSSSSAGSSSSGFNSAVASSSSSAGIPPQSQQVSKAAGSSVAPIAPTSNVASDITPTSVASKPAFVNSQSSSAPQASSSSSAGSCTDNDIICDSESTWSLCSNGSPVSMGPVADGMVCKNGAMVVAGASSSPSCVAGSITCSSDGKSWLQCSNGQLIDMGSVAAGTTCQNGTIVASSQRKRMVRHRKARIINKKH